MHIVVFGATSAIAHAWARLHAAQGDQFTLLGRDAGKLATVEQDLLARGATAVRTQIIDLALPQDYCALIEQVDTHTTIDLALFAQGSLPDQRALEQDVESVRPMFELNAMSYILPASQIAERMAQRGRGTLVLISSVAGDRGRQSNYFYGTSKAAVSTFAEGLRNHVFKRGVHVLTVKPGFVDTPMTAHLPKGGPLWATPEQIADCIEQGLMKNRNVIYTPWFWRFILLIIRHVPETVFKRLSL
jgi:decaprenylphospho-beta-D-erythro-pentofuranosid-2-ulose 2-reductase